MKNFALAAYIAIPLLSITSLIPDGPLAGRQQSTNSKHGSYPSDVMIWQPNPNLGAFEKKITDKSGKVTQWYQHFVDSEGKEIMQITRQTVGDWKPPYEGIQFITSFSYNADGNIAELHEFDGDGTLDRHVVYRYDKDGKWLTGDVYDATGKCTGHELTEPEAHLYGKKKSR